MTRRVCWLWHGSCGLSKPSLDEFRPAQGLGGATVPSVRLKLCRLPSAKNTMITVSSQLKFENYLLRDGTWTQSVVE